MSFWKTALELEADSVAFVVVTLVSVRGLAPQDPGAKAIVTSRGLHWGTVGGGKVEARCIAHSKALLSGEERGGLLTWNLQRDIGMTCGGEVTYLFEVHDSQSWPIVVFGAGHVAQALVRVLEPLECRITCIDPRAEWVERLPVSRKLKTLCLAEPASLVKTLSGNSYFVVMTQGHATDVPILDEIFRNHPSAPYVGAIGSDVKALKIRKELEARGACPEWISKLRCPIGITLGGNHPHEIAVSVVAQLLQERGKCLPHER